MEDIKLTGEELWKLRAMRSENKAMMAEITILKMRFEDLMGETKVFETMLKEKYKCDSFDNEGIPLNNTGE
jgi:hypothetical protein